MSRPISDPPAPACLAEALALIEAGLDYVNAEDLPGLPVVVQADALRTWSRLDAKRTAAEAALVGAFDASEGYAVDGQSSAASWLTCFTRCTRAAARQIVSAARRLRDHRYVARALAAGRISTSVGRLITDFCGRLPADDREAAEQVLVDVAAAGADTADLSILATEIYRRVYPNGIERDEERQAADRGLTLGKTFGGVGRLNGDLTAHATGLAEQVIGALSHRKGPEDTRTARQRRHDALVEALSLLAGANLMPDRGGAKPQVKVDIPLAALRRLPGADDAVNEWIRCKARQLAAGPGLSAVDCDVVDSDVLRPDVLRPDVLRPDVLRPDVVGPEVVCQESTSAGPRGPHSAETEPAADALTGAGLPPASAGPPAALGGAGPISDQLGAALVCDSAVTPTVSGAVDRQALDALTEEWLHGHALTRRTARASDGCGCDKHWPIALATRLRLRETLLRWAIEVLSGPGGLASFLRTGLYEGPLASPSIVLDVGKPTKTVPAHLEQAVRRRDVHCRWPGCDRPAELSQVHHIVPRAAGGSTGVTNLLTICAFHHLIAIHTWGWTLRLNGDGTTTATSPGGRTLHESESTAQRPRGTGPPNWSP